METNPTNSDLEVYKEKVLTFLRESPDGVDIKFNKTDGSLREMRATLNPSLITSTYEKTTDRVKEANPDVQAVFDVDAGSFRSFRWDSLMEVRFL
jgi:hypothetical protein